MIHFGISTLPPATPRFGILRDAENVPKAILDIIESPVWPTLTPGQQREIAEKYRDNLTKKSYAQLFEEDNRDIIVRKVDERNEDNIYEFLVAEPGQNPSRRAFIAAKMTPEGMFAEDGEDGGKEMLLWWLQKLLKLDPIGIFKNWR